MKNKLFVVLVGVSILTMMFVYFQINPSYEKSIRAKYHYEMAEYKEAYVLANEAFSLDVYNRMASTVMAQSKISLQYVAYLDDAKNYMKKVNEIATHEVITNADKAKMKLMCKIMIESYVKLAPSVVTDTDLVQEAASYYKNFEHLLEKVDR